MKRDRLAITVERRVTSGGISLRRPSCPWFHVQSPRGHPGQDGPQRHGFQGSDSQDNQDWICPQVPTQSPFLITPEEPWELITVGGQFINFLLGTRATFSMLTEAPGPLSSQSASIMGLSGQAKIYYFRFFLYVVSYSVIFFTRVSDCARISLTPFGEGYTEQGPCLCFHEYGGFPFSPLNWTKCKS